MRRHKNDERIYTFLRSSMRFCLEKLSASSHSLGIPEIYGRAVKRQTYAPSLLPQSHFSLLHISQRTLIVLLERSNSICETCSTLNGEPTLALFLAFSISNCIASSFFLELFSFTSLDITAHFDCIARREYG